MNYRIIILLISITSLAFISGCVSYPDYGSVDIRGEDVWFKVAFSDKDRRLIREYYGKTRQKHLPPGLAKKDRLPPGLEKQLIRKGTLPPGLHYRLLPLELAQQLSPLPRGYVRIRVDQDVVLLDEFTRVIVDIIYNVDD